MLDDASFDSTNAAAEDAHSTGAGALTVVPRDLAGAPRAATGTDKVPARREPTLEPAASLDDREAERVAFAMWREGRTDDAIAFLEREILLEKDRLWKRDTFAGRQEPHFGKPAPAVIVTPPPTAEAKPKGRARKRKRDAAPVSEPYFSDASAPMIELAAETVAVTPVDALPDRRMGSGPAIVAAIGLLILGFAGAANFWDNHRAEIADAAPAMAVPAMAAPPVDAPAPQTTASIIPASAKPEPTTAPAVTASIPPADSLADDAASAVAHGAPEPDVTAALQDTPAEVPAPTANASEEAVALAEPDAPVVDESAPPEPVLEDAATPPDELDEATTDADAPLVARLPSPRPEPPAGLSFTSPSSTTAHQVAVERPDRRAAPARRQRPAAPVLRQRRNPCARDADAGGIPGAA